ncbi:MAG: rhomboid family intramembrane serine protease [Treponema sp.]|nr:rhomboid family intramembrane serine protease [Treponema sp.]
MRNKKFKFPFKITYESPVTLAFVIVSLLFFIVDTFILKEKLSALFLSSPTSPKGDLPFELSKGISYLRVIFYAFGGSKSPVFFFNLLLILILGSDTEEKYGSIVIGIMILVSTIFSGVINASFSPHSLQGAASIVFMLLFLTCFDSLSKKKISLRMLIIFITLCITYSKADGPLAFSIALAGGLCGSLLAFLTSPKARKIRKASGLKEKAEVLVEIDDSNSPRFKSKASKNQEDSSDETIIGQIDF